MYSVNPKYTSPDSKEKEVKYIIAEAPAIKPYCPPLPEASGAAPVAAPKAVHVCVYVCVCVCAA